jgi:hypothetical protein
MMYLDANFDKVSNRTITQDASAVGAVCNTADGILWGFDSDGYQAKMIRILDIPLTVENWTKTDANHKIYWDTGVRKVYASRFNEANTASYDVGTTWEALFNYRTAWLPGGTAGLTR